MGFARHGLGLYFSFQILDEKKTAEALVSTRQTTIPHETHDRKAREWKEKGKKEKKQLANAVQAG